MRNIMWHLAHEPPRRLHNDSPSLNRYFVPRRFPQSEQLFTFESCRELAFSYKQNYFAIGLQFRSLKKVESCQFMWSTAVTEESRKKKHFSFFKLAKKIVKMLVNSYPFLYLRLLPVEEIFLLVIHRSFFSLCLFLCYETGFPSRRKQTEWIISSAVL